MSPALPEAKKPISAAAEIFRANLHAVMEAQSPPASQASLARQTKEHQRTVGRIINGEVAPNLDTAHAIARALRCELWQLLVPNFDPANPPVLALGAPPPQPGVSPAGPAGGRSRRAGQVRQMSSIP